MYTIQEVSKMLNEDYEKIKGYIRRNEALFKGHKVKRNMVLLDDVAIDILKEHLQIIIMRILYLMTILL